MKSDEHTDGDVAADRLLPAVPQDDGDTQRRDEEHQRSYRCRQPEGGQLARQVAFVLAVELLDLVRLAGKGLDHADAHQAFLQGIAQGCELSL